MLFIQACIFICRHRLNYCITQARTYLAKFEISKLQQQQLNSQSKSFSKWVDRTFATFANHEFCEKLLKLLNLQHPNIRFIMKKSTAAMPFLDVKTKIIDSGFDSWI